MANAHYEKYKDTIKKKYDLKIVLMVEHCNTDIGK